MKKEVDTIQPLNDVLETFDLDHAKSVIRGLVGIICIVPEIIGVASEKEPADDQKEHIDNALKFFEDMSDRYTELKGGEE